MPKYEGKNFFSFHREKNKVKTMASFASTEAAWTKRAENFGDCGNFLQSTVETKKMHLFWFLEFIFIVLYMSGITDFCGNFQPRVFVSVEAFYLFSCLILTL